MDTNLIDEAISLRTQGMIYEDTERLLLKYKEVEFQSDYITTRILCCLIDHSTPEYINLLLNYIIQEKQK